MAPHMCHLLSARAVGTLGHLLESEPVKYALALSPGQAVVTSPKGFSPHLHSFVDDLHTWMTVLQNFVQE